MAPRSHEEEPGGSARREGGGRNPGGGRAARGEEGAKLAWGREKETGRSGGRFYPAVPGVASKPRNRRALPEATAAVAGSSGAKAATGPIP